MSLLIIEVFLCITFVILIYQCCIRGARHARQQYVGEESNNNNNDNDLARVRERIRSDPFARANNASANNANDNSSESAIEARKVLINKNLFSKKIIRGEESVKELSVLLAISRGGVGGSSSSGIDDNDVDEELGGCCNDDAFSSSIANAEVPTQTEDGASPPTPISNEPAAAPQSQPEPSAPPSFEEEVAATNNVVDTVATAISSSQHDIDVEQSTTTTIRASELNNSSQQRRPSITLDPIRNLWSNLTSNNNLNRSERETITSAVTSLPKSSTNFQKDTTSCSRNTYHTHNGIVQHKLECSICLEQFTSGDTIAWAKDGGDPPPSALNTAAPVVATNNDAGCDHIFHSECLNAWLLDHSECPLCRRIVVHADAETRFLGWEM